MNALSTRPSTNYHHTAEITTHHAAKGYDTDPMSMAADLPR
jgi:hypothetical protein